MTHLGRHATVIGASMGGLLSARVLADHHEEVTGVRIGGPADGILMT